MTVYPRGFTVSHSTQGPSERLWRCPKCDFAVWRPERPAPCEDHPFDDMIEGN